MNDNIDTFAYMMATEKFIFMISIIEQTMEFMDEYKIKPDDEVIKALTPIIEQMNKWIEIK